MSEGRGGSGGPVAGAVREHPVVVVTGSAGGIGRALAVEAVVRGARVVVNSRRVERLADVVADVEAAGGEVLAVEADLRHGDQADRLAAETVERFGRLDVLVNNAAGLFFAPAEELTENGWRSVVDANLTTTFLACRAAFPYLRDQGGGTICNLSSVAALRPHPHASHYAAAKAGVNSLTETLAYEWAPHGIRVNAVVLGAVLTEASRFHRDVDRALMEAQLPGGRIVTPDEVAAAVLDLCFVETSYLTGAVVRLDGGFRGVMAPPEAP